MPLRFAIGVRAVIVAVLGVLYFSSGDSFFLALAAIAVIGGAWTAYRAMRS
ncbi:MAG: hypothetical protein OEW24_07080 [Chloroflexota bacterium]|nr:hypothetical protein [Chloroflexota bacterium]